MDGMRSKWIKSSLEKSIHLQSGPANLSNQSNRSINPIKSAESAQSNNQPNQSIHPCHRTVHTKSLKFKAQSLLVSLLCPNPFIIIKTRSPHILFPVPSSLPSPPVFRPNNLANFNPFLSPLISRGATTKEEVKRKKALKP